MAYDVNTAVMLVGGEGTRLRPYTEDTPKSLVEVGGRPILDWNTDWLKKYGVENLVLACGPKKEKFEEYLSKNNNLGFKSVSYSDNSSDGGTAEAFKLAIDRYVEDKNYVAMNGDELTNLDLEHMVQDHHERSATVTMALVPFKAPYSIAKIDGSGKISNFTYGKSLRNVPISIGIYVFNEKINDMIPEKGAIEKTVFTKLASDGELFPYMLYTGEEWATVNDHKQKMEAEDALKRWGLIK